MGEIRELVNNRRASFYFPPFTCFACPCLLKKQNDKNKNSFKKLAVAVYTEHLDESSGDKWNENLFPLSSLSKSE